MFWIFLFSPAYFSGAFLILLLPDHVHWANIPMAAKSFIQGAPVVVVFQLPLILFCG
jgi:hypothetical protein